jgi:3-deoxy-D-manno-octulosonic-acid transferase
VAFGPHHWTTAEPARVLESAGAAFCVENTAALADILCDCLSDPKRAKAQGELGRTAARNLRGAVDRTLDCLGDWLKEAGV